MTLTIGAMPSSQWQHIIPLLECLGWQSQANDPERWYQDEQAVITLPTDGRYLLLYTRPEVVITQAIDKEQHPIAALKQWQDTALHLLNFYKRYSNCSILVEIVGALQYPQNSLEEISKRLNLTVESEVPELSTPVETPALYQLLACQLVVQTPAIDNILAELKACSFLLSEGTLAAPRLDIAMLHQQLLAKDEIELQNKTALKSEEEKNELILWQLHQTQVELEKLYQQIETKRQISVKGTGGSRLIRKIDGYFKRALDAIYALLIKLIRPQNSIIWKITAPARFLIRSLRTAWAKQRNAKKFRWN
ncbi:hypothetical protein [Microbulbifer rhizosphaerae]|uniref:Uncharacterized protein n=1 Tax=Microbulbifer rhizosphaerae TaxID=1562603 RepID=A0A7W4ZAV6_9GAMM|nr:hypothetical protein [Microbulbifer rhizosphaerae]MBB3063192.1 hypothetical protein [Microbulbifer rhizosphaerae]